ncbi:uncharacterized protein LOC106638591 [Copidosoma floridanum]|uniref:uncharacterized protein LOC106638591 n=1 Tax=Copidosoma floridanum TaxID=29053 RepID=UPI0006C99910|nr:uncharacterized protein LOC106638591 [Copidosoma floridanum]
MRWPALLSLVLVVLDWLIREGHAESNATNRFRDEPAGCSSARKKRSLTFPKGTNFVLTTSIVKAIQLKEPANWNLDLEFDMIWPIPKGPDAMRRPPPTGWHRRHRRELYSNFALALDSQGVPGKQCVLRAICEAQSVLNPPGVSLVEDLIRVVFSYPLAGLEHDVYDAAARADDCASRYRDCRFSILHLLLGLDEE